MKHKKFGIRLSSLLLTVFIIFSSISVVFAVEIDETEKALKHFGKILSVNNGVTVFYGNPYENEAEAKAIEAKAARSLQYDQVWVDAYHSSNEFINIPASSSNPITYYTIRQETTSPLHSSNVYVSRPDGTTGFIWEMSNTTQEIADRRVGTKIEPNRAYAWTYGTLKLRWQVETGASGARMNLWVW